VTSNATNKVFSRMEQHINDLEDRALQRQACLMPLCMGNNGEEYIRFIRHGRSPKVKPHIRLIGGKWVALYTEQMPEHLKISAWELQKKLNSKLGDC
jgi:hypothetical protein